MTSVFLVNLVSTLFMTGVIWFVQLVHYPLFRRASRTMFFEFVRGHSIRTSWTVMPPMLVELLSSIALLMQPPEFLESALAQLGVVLVAAIWLSTFLVQVPLHRKLSNGYSATAVRALVLTNWIRTLLWTARAILLLLVLAEVLKSVS